MNFSAIILSLVTAVIFQSGSPCHCIKLGKTETTKTGWMSITIPAQAPVRIVRGKILNLVGEPIPDAFVELFNKRRRVAGCRVGAHGEFCFTGIASGKYLLRASQTNFDTISTTVRVNRRLKKSGRLEITLPTSN